MLSSGGSSFLTTMRNVELLLLFFGTTNEWKVVVSVPHQGHGSLLGRLAAKAAVVVVAASREL